MCNRFPLLLLETLLLRIYIDPLLLQRLWTPLSSAWFHLDTAPQTQHKPPPDPAPTEETATADTAIVDDDPSLDYLTPELPPADDSTNPDPLLDPAISMTLEPDLTNDHCHIRSDSIVPAAQVESDTPASSTDDSSEFLNYTYSPPLEKVIQNFDPTQQLGSQIDDLINDNLNTFTTEGKHEQIRISSLNIEYPRTLSWASYLTIWISRNLMS